MKQFGLDFHHLGLAVKQVEGAIAFLRGLEYRIGPQVYDPLQRVNLVLCRSSTMPDVELISPADVPGPLDSILKNRSELIYHLCYTSADVGQSLRHMRAVGHRVAELSPPKAAILFQGRPVSFYLVRGFGVIEILESCQQEATQPASRPSTNDASVTLPIASSRVDESKKRT